MPFLHEAPFSAMDEKVRDAIMHKSRLIRFLAGEPLYLQGQEGYPLYFLTEGLVKLSATASHGKECVLHIIRPGTFVDLGMLFYEGGSPCSAFAVSSSKAYLLDKNQILLVMTEYPLFALEIMRRMTLRERLFINKLVGSQGRISVACRVSSWLLHRSRMEGGNVIFLDVNRELMARVLGVTRESFSRELSRLQGAGAISVKRRAITLLDKKILMKEALQ